MVSYPACAVSAICQRFPATHWNQVSASPNAGTIDTRTTLVCSFNS